MPAIGARMLAYIQLDLDLAHRRLGRSILRREHLPHFGGRSVCDEAHFLIRHVQLRGRALVPRDDLLEIAARDELFDSSSCPRSSAARASRRTAVPSATRVRAVFNSCGRGPRCTSASFALASSSRDRACSSCTRRSALSISTTMSPALTRSPSLTRTRSIRPSILAVSRSFTQRLDAPLGSDNLAKSSRRYSEFSGRRRIRAEPLLLTSNHQHNDDDRCGHRSTAPPAPPARTDGRRFERCFVSDGRDRLNRRRLCGFDRRGGRRFGVRRVCVELR